MDGRAPGDRAETGTPAEPGSEHVILAVDGDPAVIAWLETVLPAAGMTISSAADGRAALRLVADDRVRPDVLLTELELAGMSGVELAARATAMRPGVRVVMMTADPDRAAVARGHRSIVATVLLKPLRAEDVVAAIRRPDAAAPVA